MCGRYVRKSDKQRIAEAFPVRGGLDGLAMPPDDYNVAPSTFQPVLRESRDTGDRELVLMRWRLIPFFTKSLSEIKGISTINARAETVPISRLWREPLKKRRCLIPASAFYEWKRINTKTKQPFAFSVTDHPLFAFAGLWDAWKDADGHWLQLFSIVTTVANELMSSVHTRDAGHPSSARLLPLALSGGNRAAAHRSSQALRVGRHGNKSRESLGRERLEQWP